MKGEVRHSHDPLFGPPEIKKIINKIEGHGCICIFIRGPNMQNAVTNTNMMAAVFLLKTNYSCPPFSSLLFLLALFASVFCQLTT